MLRALTLAAVLIGCNGDKGTHTGDTAPTTTPAPVEVVDSYTQTLNSPVDILWVLDRNWTDGLSALDADLLNYEFQLLLLADPSWKIGILDSTAQGQSDGIISPQLATWPNGNPIGTKPPQGPSKIRESIHLALELRKDNQINRDFVRPGADLYVIVFTGAEDASQDPPPGTGVTSEISQKDFNTWFEGFQPSATKRLSVITTSDATKYWGKHLQGGGILYEVGSFRKALQTLFLDAIGQKTVFPLSQVPATPPDTVVVRYRQHDTDYVLGADYSYDPATNTIAFDKVIPPPGAIVEITYLPADEATQTSPTSTSTGG